MNHLNAGEIHAWLDGAVDATQAREIETHVAECPTCAAAVADARGYIAASSRILNALDDVPAGVTPKRAPSRAPVRQWRAAPWVTGIAAALILTVGITTWNRRAVREEMPAMRATSAVPQHVESLSAVAVPLPQQAPMAGALSATPPAAPAKKSAQREVATKTSGPTRAAESQRVAAAPGGRSAGGAAAGAPMSASAADVRAPMSKAAIGGVVRPLSDQKVANAAVMEAPPVAAAAPEARTRDAIKLRPAPQRLEASADVDELIGCYRVADATRIRSASPSAGAILGKVAARRSAAAPSMTPSATYDAPQQMIVRLDTTSRPLGYAVRSATSDSIIGWWVRINGDSARVDLLSSGRLQVARRDQITCPER